MTKYRVDIVQRVVEAATMYIEAASQEEAEDLAVRRALLGLVNWSFLEAPENPEVVRCEPIGEPVT